MAMVLAGQRDTERHTVHPGESMVVHEGADLRWWTWAGFRTNATLASTLSELVDGT